MRGPAKVGPDPTPTLSSLVIHQAGRVERAGKDSWGGGGGGWVVGASLLSHSLPGLTPTSLRVTHWEGGIKAEVQFPQSAFMLVPAHMVDFIFLTPPQYPSRGVGY